MYLAPAITLLNVVALSLFRGLEDLQNAPPSASSSMSNKRLSHEITDMFKSSENTAIQDKFKTEIENSQIESLTQHELIEAHLCLLYIKDDPNRGTSPTSTKKHEEIIKRIKAFKEEKVTEHFAEIFFYLQNTKFEAVQTHNHSHHLAVLNKFLDLFVVMHVIRTDIQLLPKFQVHEIFETLDGKGHIRSDGRFFGKLRMIHRVYQIPQTKDFMTEIRQCLSDEEKRTKFCYPIILSGRMEYIDDDENAELGEFRHEMLSETQEFIYNAISQFKEYDIKMIPDRPDFATELLLTECVLRDIVGTNHSTRQLQIEHAVVENIKLIKLSLRQSKNLSNLKKSALEACRLKQNFVKSSLMNVLVFIKRFIYTDQVKDEYVPDYLQHLIYDLCVTLGGGIQDKDIAPYADILHSFKQTWDFLKIIKSKLRVIGEFNEFMRNLIEDIFEYTPKPDGKRTDLIAIKKLYLTLMNMDRMLIPKIVVEAILSPGNRQDILILHNALKLVENLNLSEGDVEAVEVIRLTRTRRASLVINKIGDGVIIKQNIMDLSSTILKFRYLKQERDTRGNWKYLEELISSLWSTGVHIPISLQFGIVGFRAQLPEHMQKLREMAEHCSENVNIRIKVRGCLQEKRELNSTIERQISKLFANETRETPGSYVAIAKILYLTIANIDLLEMNGNQLSFTNMVMIKWIMGVLDKPQTFDRRDVSTLAQNVDYKANSKFIKERITDALSRHSNERKYHHANEYILEFGLKRANKILLSTHVFQGQVTELLINILFKKDNKNLVSALTILLQQKKNQNVHVAPPIACGIKSIQSAGHSVHLTHSQEIRFTRTCEALQKLQANRKVADQNGWQTLLNRSLDELYTAHTIAQLQNRAYEFYTFLSGLHDLLRNQLREELKIRIRIALEGLREVFPNDRSTIEWLQLSEINHKMLSKPVLENILRSYQEVDEFTKTVQNVEIDSQLCTIWLMILLKAFYCKERLHNSADYENILRSTEYPAKMVEIDHSLKSHCSNDAAINLLNDIRCELNYFNFIDLSRSAVTSSFIHTDYCTESTAQASGKHRRPNHVQRKQFHMNERSSPNYKLTAEQSQPNGNTKREIVLCEWPCSPSTSAQPATQVEDELSNSRLVSSSSMALPSASSTAQTSSFELPAETRRASPTSTLDSRRSYFSAPIKPSQSMDGIVVVKPEIDSLYATIPVVPFRASSNRNAYERIKAANELQQRTKLEPAQKTGVEQKMAESGLFSKNFTEDFQQLDGTKLRSKYPREFDELSKFLEQNFSNLEATAPVFVASTAPTAPVVPAVSEPAVSGPAVVSSTPVPQSSISHLRGQEFIDSLEALVKAHNAEMEEQRRNGLVPADEGIDEEEDDDEDDEDYEDEDDDEEDFMTVEEYIKYNDFLVENFSLKFQQATGYATRDELEREFPDEFPKLVEFLTEMRGRMKEE